MYCENRTRFFMPTMLSSMETCCDGVKCVLKVALMVSRTGRTLLHGSSCRSIDRPDTRWIKENRRSDITEAKKGVYWEGLFRDQFFFFIKPVLIHRPKYLFRFTIVRSVTDQRLMRELGRRWITSAGSSSNLVAYASVRQHSASCNSRGPVDRTIKSCAGTWSSFPSIRIQSNVVYIYIICVTTMQYNVSY